MNAVTTPRPSETTKVQYNESQLGWLRQVRDLAQTGASEDIQALYDLNNQIPHCTYEDFLAVVNAIQEAVKSQFANLTALHDAAKKALMGIDLDSHTRQRTHTPDELKVSFHGIRKT